MTDSCIPSNNSFVEPERVKTKKFQGRSPDIVIEQRCQRLYKRQLEGLTTRQLVLDHAAKEGVHVNTAWNDWKRVNKWNDEDWQKDRENMLARIQSMRIRLFNQSIKKGNSHDRILLGFVGQIEMVRNILERESLGFPSFFQIHPIGGSLRVFENGLEEMLYQEWALLS